MSLTSPSLVISEGEEEDNEDHNAEDVAATADIDDKEEENDDDDDNDDDNDDDDNYNGDDDNDNNDDDDNATMPPKVKPVTMAASKTAKKKAKKADEIALFPAPKLPNIRTYSIKAEDPFTISYYTNGKHDYANAVICVNGTMEYGEYEVQVAKDGRSILFVHPIYVKSFNKGSTTTRAAPASLPGTIWCRRRRGRRSTPKMDFNGKSHR